MAAAAEARGAAPLPSDYRKMKLNKKPAAAVVAGPTTHDGEALIEFSVEGLEEIVNKYAHDNSKKARKRCHSTAWHAERSRCLATGYSDAEAKERGSQYAAQAIKIWSRKVNID